MKIPFDRTSCVCREDRANCTIQPGHLLPGQLAEIMAHLKEGVENAAKYFWNSPGMLLLRGGTELIRIRTITPRFEDGKCVFYRDGRCEIHAVAPFGCAYFDVHMGNREAQRRRQWGVRFVTDHLDGYAAQRDSLPLATHHKPRTAL